MPFRVTVTTSPRATRSIIAPARALNDRIDTSAKAGWYVPHHRQRALVQHLLRSCERLIVGVFNEEAHARPTEDLLRSWSFDVVGRVDRPNRQKPGIDYRIVWIDSSR